jgi:hypothetical protein
LLWTKRFAEKTNDGWCIKAANEDFESAEVRIRHWRPMKKEQRVLLFRLYQASVKKSV